MLPYVFLLATFSTRLACGAPDSLAARAVVALGPQGTCPAIQDTLYELQPVYYSSFFPQNSVIDPLHDGHPITISNAPIALVLQTYVTMVVTRPGDTPSDGTAPVQGVNAGTHHLTPTDGNGPTLSPPFLRGPLRFSSTSTSSNIASLTKPAVVVNGQTITAGAPALTINGTPVSLAAGGTALIIGTQTVQPEPGSSAIAAQSIALTPNIQNLVVAGQTIFPGEITTINGIHILYAADGGYAVIGTQTIYPGSGTATVAGSAISLAAGNSVVGVSSATAISTSSQPLTIGAGIPSGTLTSLPSESPILLAFSDINVANQRLVRRQAATTPDSAAATSASAVSVVNLASLTATAQSPGQTMDNTVAASDCDGATPFILSEGLLLHDGSAVGKIRFAQTALLGPLTDPPNDQVNKTFSVQNAILHWNTADLGSAVFWSCTGTLYAGFPQAPDDTCTSVVLGVISAQACEAKVAEEAAASAVSLMVSSTLSGPATTIVSSNLLNSKATGSLPMGSISQTSGSNATPTLVPSFFSFNPSSAYLLPSSDTTSLSILSVHTSISMPYFLSTDSSTFAISYFATNSIFATSIKATFGGSSTTALLDTGLSSTLPTSGKDQIVVARPNTSSESFFSASETATKSSILSQTVTPTKLVNFELSIAITAPPLSGGLPYFAATPPPNQSTFALSPFSSASTKSDSTTDTRGSMSLLSSSGSSVTNTVSVTVPQMLSSATTMSIKSGTMSDTNFDTSKMSFPGSPSTAATSNLSLETTNSGIQDTSLIVLISYATLGPSTYISSNASTFTSSSSIPSNTGMRSSSSSSAFGTALALESTTLQTLASPVASMSSLSSSGMSALTTLSSGTIITLLPSTLASPSAAAVSSSLFIWTISASYSTQGAIIISNSVAALITPISSSIFVMSSTSSSSGTQGTQGTASSVVALSLPAALSTQPISRTFVASGTSILLSAVSSTSTILSSALSSNMLTMSNSSPSMIRTTFPTTSLISSTAQPSPLSTYSSLPSSSAPVVSSWSIMATASMLAAIFMSTYGTSVYTTSSTMTSLLSSTVPSLTSDMPLSIIQSLTGNILTMSSSNISGVTSNYGYSSSSTLSGVNQQGASPALSSSNSPSNFVSASGTSTASSSGGATPARGSSSTYGQSNLTGTNNTSAFSSGTVSGTTPFSGSPLGTTPSPSSGVDSISAPKSSELVSGTSVSFSAVPSAAGSLCAGENIGTSAGATGIGASNYQIVQQGANSYEIECYASIGGTGNSVTGIASFQAAIALCDNINVSNGLGTCLGMTWDQSTDIATIISQLTPGTQAIFGATIRSARLIFSGSDSSSSSSSSSGSNSGSGYPFITDAVYLQPTSTANNIGLCTNGAYAYDAVSPQYNENFDNIYENECGRYFSGTNPISQVTVSSYASILSAQGTISSPVQDSEDVLKLCDYANHQIVNSCVMYTFDTTQHTYTLYGSTNGTISTNPTINAGRLINAAVGYPTPTDRPSVTGFVYAFQYVSMTVPTLSSGTLGESSGGTSGPSATTDGVSATQIALSATNSASASQTNVTTAATLGTAGDGVTKTPQTTNSGQGSSSSTLSPPDSNDLATSLITSTTIAGQAGSSNSTASGRQASAATVASVSTSASNFGNIGGSSTLTSSSASIAGSGGGSSTSPSFSATNPSSIIGGFSTSTGAASQPSNTANSATLASSNTPPSTSNTGIPFTGQASGLSSASTMTNIIALPTGSASSSGVNSAVQITILSSMSNIGASGGTSTSTSSSGNAAGGLSTISGVGATTVGVSSFSSTAGVNAGSTTNTGGAGTGSFSSPGGSFAANAGSSTTNGILPGGSSSSSSSASIVGSITSSVSTLGAFSSATSIPTSSLGSFANNGLLSRSSSSPASSLAVNSGSSTNTISLAGSSPFTTGSPTSTLGPFMNSSLPAGTYSATIVSPGGNPVSITTSSLLSESSPTMSYTAGNLGSSANNGAGTGTSGSTTSPAALIPITTLSSVAGSNYVASSNTPTTSVSSLSSTITAGPSYPIPTTTNINYCSISASANALGVPVVVSLGNGLCSTYYTSATILAVSAGIGPCSFAATANILGIPVVVSLSNGLCSTYYTQTNTASILQLSAGVGPCSIAATANALGLPVVVSLGNGLCSTYYISATNTGLALPMISTSLGGMLSGSIGANLGGSSLSLSAPSVPVVTVPLGATLDSCGIGATVGALGVPVVIDAGGSCSTYYTSQLSTITVTQITVISMSTTGASPASNLATTTTNNVVSGTTTIQVLGLSASVGSCGVSASVGVLGIPVVISLGNGQCSTYYTSVPSTISQSSTVTVSTVPSTGSATTRSTSSASSISSTSNMSSSSSSISISGSIITSRNSSSSSSVTGAGGGLGLSSLLNTLGLRLEGGM